MERYHLRGYHPRIVEKLARQVYILKKVERYHLRGFWIAGLIGEGTALIKQTILVRVQGDLSASVVKRLIYLLGMEKIPVRFRAEA